jgi:hypothetical protein
MTKWYKPRPARAIDWSAQRAQSAILDPVNPLICRTRFRPHKGLPLIASLPKHACAEQGVGESGGLREMTNLERDRWAIHVLRYKYKVRCHFFIGPLRLCTAANGHMAKPLATIDYSLLKYRCPGTYLYPTVMRREDNNRTELPSNTLPSNPRRQTKPGAVSKHYKRLVSASCSATANSSANIATIIVRPKFQLEAVWRRGQHVRKPRGGDGQRTFAETLGHGDEAHRVVGATGHEQPRRRAEPDDRRWELVRLEDTQ